MTEPNQVDAEAVTTQPEIHDVSRQRQALALTLAIAVIAAAAGVMALSFNSAARIVPLSAALLTAVLAAVQVIREYRGLVAIRRTDHSDARVEPVPASTESEPGQAEDAPRAFAEHSTASAFGWVLLLAGLVLVLGMVLAIPTFCVLFMRRYARERWSTILIVIVLLEVLHYLAFFVFLSGQDYTGLIGPEPEGLL